MIFKYGLSSFGVLVIGWLMFSGFLYLYSNFVIEEHLEKIRETCEKENYYKEKFLFIKCKNVLVKEEKILDF